MHRPPWLRQAVPRYLISKGVLPVSDLDEILGAQRADDKIKRDQWGRYLLPNPETGKTQGWTRVTTIAKTLDDPFGLQGWGEAMVALGIGRRKDLYAQAASMSSWDEDKDDLKALVKDAKAAAASGARANLGTAVHRFSERMDRGETVKIPEELEPDLIAYAGATSLAGVGVEPGWIERVIICPELQAAGTLDRVNMAAGWRLPKIGDVKTGKTLEYAGLSIAIQLAIYANASHWWNPQTGKLVEMIPVDKDEAIVWHIPIGKGICVPYTVDIAAGWEAAQLAFKARVWRKRKGLLVKLEELPSDTYASRLAWVRDRVRIVIDAGHGAELAAKWPTGVPTLREGGLSDDQLTKIGDACSKVEAKHGMSFGDNDPGVPVDAPDVEEEPKAKPPEPEKPSGPTPADRARAKLSSFERDTWAGIAAAAMVDPTAVMTEADLWRIGAVADALSGGELAFSPSDGVCVTHKGEQCATEHYENGKAVLAEVRKACKAFGIKPVPRSCSAAVTNPLLVAHLLRNIPF